MRWLSLLAFLCSLLVPAAAQDAGRLTLAASFEPAAAKPGDEVVLVLVAAVQEGYHAYGTKEPTNLPVALDPAKVKTNGLELVGAAKIPPGLRKSVLGMESYPLPNVFTVRQTLKVPAGANAGEVEVSGEFDYQVCDENSCEPQTTAPFRAKLVVEAGAAPVPPPEPVAEEAGRLTLAASFEPAAAKPGDEVVLVLVATVQEGYHAYGTKEPTNLPVALDPAKVKTNGLELVGPAKIPPGLRKDTLGMESYPLPNVFTVRQTLKVPAGAVAGEVEVSGEFDYQVCDENSCEPQTTAPFRAKLVVEAGAGGGRVEAGGTRPEASGPRPGPKAPAAKGAGAADLSWWALILFSIGGGLFALAMPCTYPMIPITFSFFTKQAEKRHGKVLPLALTYGFGIVVMFTLVGALLSTVIVDVVNHWITNAVIATVFLFFAFVLFGWINLEPPQWLQNAAGRASRTGGLLGVFFMGATLVISSFTCTAPIVGSLLANVAQYGVGRVSFGMAIFGLTMAAPFVFLALIPTKVKSMPRSGEWMETLKVSLGFVELAATLKFVSMVDFALAWQILPRELFLMLWVAILGLWALYLFGILRKAGVPNEGVGAGRMAAGMFVTLLTAYFFFGSLGYQLDFYTTNFIPNYSARSVVARAGGGGHGNGDQGHVLGDHRIVLDDQPKAVQVAVAEDKLLLYNFTGFN